MYLLQTTVAICLKGLCFACWLGLWELAKLAKNTIKIQNIETGDIEVYQNYEKYAENTTIVQLLSTRLAEWATILPLHGIICAKYILAFLL